LADSADRPASRSRLAYWRERRGYTQRGLSVATGLTRSTYWRLETGGYPNPPLRYLINCAIVLEVGLYDLLEPEWLHWLGRPHTQAPAPPPGRPGELTR
jgi:transcriptional regulator with XRE-family HTH domain